MAENDMMQAIRFHEYGGPEQLVLESVPRPVIQPQTVLVRVYAAGVNPVDWKIRQGPSRQGRPLQFPQISGIDLAGIVEDLGSGVTEFQRGQAIYGNASSGSYAEYALAAASAVAPKPASLTFDQAAAVPIGALTAWRSLFDTAGLQAGQHVLIHGAAGGVGSFAVQLARWKGAHVIGTASAGNLDLVRSLGAEQAVDYRAAPFENVVHDMDVVLDTVGGDTLDRSWQVLRPGGILVSIAGQPSQEVAQGRGVRAGMPGRADPARVGGLLRQIGALLESGQIKVQVGEIFPLAQARQAHVLSEQRHGRGRIVLHVRDM